MRRKNRFDTFVEAPARGNYDEMPMLEIGIDPQLHLSRNSVAQPFFLICEQDTMLAQVGGQARIEFRGASVNYFDLDVGDFVYVPGGTPHRLVPNTESIHLRYKAEHPGLEAVAWYSEQTGQEISRVTWDCAVELPQSAYLRACTAFNSDASMRTSKVTGQVLPKIDLAPFRWAALAMEIAEAIETETARKAGDEDATPIATAPRSVKTAIPAPDGRKAPLRTNAYRHARVETTMLSPLFPYFDAGSLVPCITVRHPGKRESWGMGYFIHHNTVQEVLLCVGAKGSNYLRPGFVAVGPYTHPVGEKPGQPMTPDQVAINVVTQRQSNGAQSEAVTFLCEKCEAEIFKREYSAHDFPDTLEGAAPAALVGLPTISQSAVAAVDYNDTEASRTCKSCGHVNRAFPLANWGWEEYRRRTHAAILARRTMMDAVSQPAKPA